MTFAHTISQTIAQTKAVQEQEFKARTAKGQILFLDELSKVSPEDMTSFVNAHRT